MKKLLIAILFFAPLFIKAQTRARYDSNGNVTYIINSHPKKKKPVKKQLVVACHPKRKCQSKGISIY